MRAVKNIFRTWISIARRHKEYGDILSVSIASEYIKLCNVIEGTENKRSRLSTWGKIWYREPSELKRSKRKCEEAASFLLLVISGVGYDRSTLPYGLACEYPKCVTKYFSYYATQEARNYAQKELESRGIKTIIFNNLQLPLHPTFVFNKHRWESYI